MSLETLSPAIAPASRLRWDRWDDNDYPESDPTAMPDSRPTRDVEEESYDTLEFHYADQPDTYVCAGDLVYYLPGDRQTFISPDVYVVHGVEKRQRRNYLIWEEGKSLDFVLEVLSVHTAARDRDDLNGKKWIYREHLKVPEYFRFDFRPGRPRAIEGDRLIDGAYVPIPAIDGRLHSRVLRADLVVENARLQYYDGVTGERWLTRREAEAAGRLAAERRADWEATARFQADHRANQEIAARVQAELRASQEIIARGQSELRANQEIAAREKLEAEFSKLEAELARMKSMLGNPGSRKGV